MLYPPLTPQQLDQLEYKVSVLREFRNNIQNYELPSITKPGDEDDLVRRVAELRGHVEKFSLELFRIFGLVHVFKDSNVVTSLPQPRASRPNADSLLELLK